MSEITLNIDGKVCKGTAGDTILGVARKNDVYIPTLCYLEGISAIGSCRMCVVEVEGSNKLLTSCTTPATDGMVVHTQTEKLKEYRRQILELLFAGRNHFCMFCSQSGDCELQRLAIEHGMDKVRYPYLYADFHNDASDEDLQVDHNRCILCLRCIRICDEKVGAHTLDLEKRGWNASVVSDLGKVLGESDTCVSCGACAQVCPTGTITIRDFVYRGRRNDCDEVVESICPLCPVGCKIKAYVRTGSITRVEGASVTSPDGGQLCHKGRWWLPESTERERLSVPMIRTGSTFREASWDEALGLVADKLRTAKIEKKAGALVSGLSTDEELSVISDFFRDSLKIDKIDCFNGDTLRGFEEGFKPFLSQGVRPFTAAHNILDSDAIIVIGGDPQNEAPVVASYIRVATVKNGAKLINFSAKDNPFEDITDADIRISAEVLHGALVSFTEAVAGREDAENRISSVADLANMEPEEIAIAAKYLADAKKTIVVLGSRLAKHPQIVMEAVNMAITAKGVFDDGLGLVPMILSGNSLGAWNTVLGKTPWLETADLDFLYVNSTGMVAEDPKSLEAMNKARFVVVHTPYMVSPLVNMADVLLPMPAWYERSGHFCTLEGERRRMNMVVPPKEGLRGLSKVFQDLASKMGVSLSTSSASPCENAFKSKISPDKAQVVSSEEV
ncbi:MAG: molybdopterin-dependent oxidoreductase [Aminobacterium sp.]|nr:molybdopterin-dependent oxidoreductase [Aminobacterium sp.]MDD3426215.1 molybdopterin-dependent oxidoreductase [Aminobacterium sp.]MDD3707590.1 molybdopterin-dependent oxidoreductase [Aminobacterium sp.]MDD4227899.1 molybdopterin-dependent oxidoreductase [Aminobacterium sp.]MDD4550661.1 molybdopterin-dependent oxidoreductase [Aminobacterium sp.]